VRAGSRGSGSGAGGVGSVMLGGDGGSVTGNGVVGEAGPGLDNGGVDVAREGECWRETYGMQGGWWW
jgi:hypothetical protein